MKNIEKLKILNARMQDLSDMINDMNQKYRELEKERYEPMTIFICLMVNSCYV